MSEHESWLAVKGLANGDLLEILGLEETGEVGWPHEVGRPYSYALLPSGWTIVYANFNGLADIENIRELSRHGLVLVCDFQDQVDAPSAILLAARDGEQLWKVATAGDEVIVAGTPPTAFASIRDHCAAELAEDPGCAWMYELPFELAKTICGYRHDQDETSFRGLRPRADSQWHPKLKMANHPNIRAAPPVLSFQKERSEFLRRAAAILMILLILLLAFIRIERL